ncbi:MAG: hypothetical protein GF334_07340 [Candidatus Altiarchaeales archaeon]|nr:hypothetical protein [Candidatus Altiarchaeales archaeon]
MKESGVYGFFDTEDNSSRKLISRIDLKTTTEQAGGRLERDLDDLEGLSKQLSGGSGGLRRKKNIH